MKTAEGVDIRFLGNVIPFQEGGRLQTLFRVTAFTGQIAFQRLGNPGVVLFIEIGVEVPCQFGIVAETVHDLVQQGHIVLPSSSALVALGKKFQVISAGILIPEFLSQLDGFSIINLGVL